MRHFFQPLSAALIGLLLAAGCATAPAKVPAAPATQVVEDAACQAAAWFEAHRGRPPMLRAFLQRMPKGADLHTHVSGAVYAESYIAWAAEADLCVVRATGAITEPPCSEGDSKVPMDQAYQDDAFYNATIDALSTRNLTFAGRSGHDQFFAAFAKLGSGTLGDYMAELVGRAASQQVFYVEGMLTLRSSAVRGLGRQVGFDGDFAASRDRLLAAGLRDEVERGRKDLDTIEARLATLLECSGEHPQAGCGVTRRYLQQTTRTGQPAEVYAQLLFAFELAKAEPRVVGLNLVAPEDHPTALRDYELQMRMLGFLHGLFPEVSIALHAGELTLGLVPPEELRFHIRQAVEVAGAKRIGHGVAVAYEDDALSLFRTMRDRGVLVEICLTSNDVILGVKDAQHPFQDYLRLGVPVTLASDDEGISRIDLTHEYWRAATTYGLAYPALKALARNSLSHSFLAGRSLWQSSSPLTPVTDCAADRPGDAAPSKPCQAFLAASDRAREQWRLERELAEFERLPWWREGFLARPTIEPRHR